MSLLSCSMCWNVPCVCGHGYKYFSDEYFSKFIAGIIQYRSKEDAKYILQKAMDIVDFSEEWKDENTKR